MTSEKAGDIMEELGLEPAVAVSTRPARIQLPAHRKRTARLTVPVNQEEFERFHAAAVRAEKTLSEWVRHCCEMKVKQAVEEAQ